MKNNKNEKAVTTEEILFNESVKAESNLRKAIEKAVSDFIKSEFSEMPEDFECFLRLDCNKVSLVNCA